MSESHTGYPSLIWFRSPDATRSWLLALSAVLDAAALHVALAPAAAPRQARLALRMGTNCLRSLADALRISYDADPRPTDPVRLRRAEFDGGFDLLESVHFPIETTREEGWRHFEGWRVNYESIVDDLTRLVLPPPAPWLLARPGIGDARSRPSSTAPLTTPRARTPLARSESQRRSARIALRGTSDRADTRSSGMYCRASRAGQLERSVRPASRGRAGGGRRRSAPPRRPRRFAGRRPERVQASEETAIRGVGPTHVPRAPPARRPQGVEAPVVADPGEGVAGDRVLGAPRPARPRPGGTGARRRRPRRRRPAARPAAGRRRHRGRPRARGRGAGGRSRGSPR